MVRVIPMVYTCVLIGSLSLMALPYLSGYYSKDMILEVSYSQYRLNGRVTNWLGLITATITSLYTIRMISYTFLNNPNGRRRIYSGMNGTGVPKKEELNYVIPLMILAIGSIFLGYMTKEVFVGIGTTYMSSIFVHPQNSIGIEIEEIPGYKKMLPVISTMMGGVIYIMMRKWRKKKEIVGVRYRGRWMNMVIAKTGRGYDWWDNIYNAIIISGGSKISYMMAKNIDKGVLEIIGPLGLRRVFLRISRRMMEMDSGYIPQYGLYIIVGTVIIIMSMTVL